MRPLASLLFLVLTACDPCAGTLDLASYPGDFARLDEIPASAWETADTEEVVVSTWSCEQRACGDGTEVTCNLINGSPHYDESWHLQYDAEGRLTYASDGGCGNNWGERIDCE